MSRHLGLVSVVVADYDQAIDWYVGKLGFALIEDTDLGTGKRWVVVAPQGDSAARLLLAQASDEAQRAAIGNQTGGRVFLFLNTDDFDRDYESMRKNGVKFRENPRREAYGSVAVFEDICGNLWDLIEHKR